MKSSLILSVLFFFCWFVHSCDYEKNILSKDKTEKSDLNKIDSLKRLINEAAYNRDLENSMRLSEALLEFDKKNLFAMCRIGLYRIIKSDSKNAIKILNKAIKLDVENKYNRNFTFLAVAYNEVSMFDSSKFYFEKMLIFNSSRAVDIQDIIIWFEITKNYKKVKEYVDLALKYYPHDVFCNTVKANYLVNLDKEYKKALLIFSKVPEYDRDAFFYSSRGACYGYLRDFDNCLLDFKKAHELEPDNSLYITGLARAYQRLNKFSEAKEYYSLAISKGDTVALRLLNSMLLQ
jgi:tetratricopeptide (TPR) repeat protein